MLLLPSELLASPRAVEFWDSFEPVKKVDNLPFRR
jgi:hypothetical protein